MNPLLMNPLLMNPFSLNRFLINPLLMNSTPISTTVPIIFYWSQPGPMVSSLHSTTKLRFCGEEFLTSFFTFFTFILRGLRHNLPARNDTWNEVVNGRTVYSDVDSGVVPISASAGSSVNDADLNSNGIIQYVGHMLVPVCRDQTIGKTNCPGLRCHSQAKVRRCRRNKNRSRKDILKSLKMKAKCHLRIG